MRYGSGTFKHNTTRHQAWKESLKSYQVTSSPPWHQTTSLSGQGREGNAGVRYRGGLQVGKELLEPVFGGFVVLEAAGEGLVLELVG